MILSKINLLLIFSLILFIGIRTPSISIADDTVVKVFKMNYRIAEEMEDAVRLFLSPDGGIAVDKRTNSLIVKDYPENISKVEEFLKTQDIKTEQVMIKVKYVDENALKKFGLNINWYYRDKHWLVGNIAGSRKGLNIDAFIGAEKGRQKISGEQSLLIMSGSEGRIAVGISMPYTDWFYWYTQNLGYVIKSTRFIDVSTGFVASPRVSGDNINITIIPQINYSGDGGTGEIIFRDVSTTVICKNGETVLIGSSTSSSENLVRNIFGGIAGSKTEGNFYMLLTPEIMH